MTASGLEVIQSRFGFNERDAMNFCADFTANTVCNSIVSAVCEKLECKPSDAGERVKAIQRSIAFTNMVIGGDTNKVNKWLSSTLLSTGIPDDIVSTITETITETISGKIKSAPDFVSRMISKISDTVELPPFIVYKKDNILYIDGAPRDMVRHSSQADADKYINEIKRTTEFICMCEPHILAGIDLVRDIEPDFFKRCSERLSAEVNLSIEAGDTDFHRRFSVETNKINECINRCSDIMLISPS